MIGRFRAAWGLLLCSLSAVECARNNHIFSASEALQVATGRNLLNTVDPVASGQTIRFEFAGWKIGGVITLNGAGGDIVLQLTLSDDVDGKKGIQRQSIIGGTPSLVESWGGWPLGPSSRAWSLELTLTDTMWQVTLDNARSPWFDFAFASIPATTGWELTDLTTSTTPAVADKSCNIECLTGSGNECLFCSSSSGCYSKESTADQNTNCAVGSDNSYCCDGTKSPVLTINSISEGDVVSMVNVISGDSTYVDRACAATETQGPCADIKPLQAGAKVVKMRVVSKEIGNNGPTGRVTAYIPTLGTSMMFSPWVLVRDEEATYTVSVTGDPGMKIDIGSSMLKETYGSLLSELAVLGFQHSVFLTRVNEFQFTMVRLRTFANSATQYSITLSDTPRPTQDANCITDYTWRDSLSQGCTKYAQSGWCTVQGLTTDTWRRERCSGGNCALSLFASDSISALDACCSCGGGYFFNAAPAPSPLPVNPPTPVVADPAPNPSPTPVNSSPSPVPTPVSAPSPTPTGGEQEDPDPDRGLNGIKFGDFEVTYTQLAAGGGAVALLLFGCCCCVMRGGSSSSAQSSVGNRQLPPPQQQGANEASVPFRRDDSEEVDRARGSGRSENDRGSGGGGHDRDDDRQNYRDDQDDYEAEDDDRRQDRDETDYRSDRRSRGRRDRSQGHSDRQSRSMSRSRSDISEGDEQGASPSLAPGSARGERGRRHQPRSRRKDRGQ